MAFQRRNGGRQQAPPQREEPSNNGSGNKPIWSRSLASGKGQRIEVAIWENEVTQDNRTFTVYSVSITRNYHDGKEWKSTSGFKEGDLGAVALAAQMAATALAENRAEGADDQH